MSKEKKERLKTEQEEIKQEEVCEADSVSDSTATKEKTTEMVTLQQYNLLKEQASMLANMMREIQSDFENYRRHTKEMRQDGIDEGIRQACSAILPAMDTFKKAKKLTLDNAVLNGILMIETNIINALEKLGVTKISAKGMFDPEVHNAVMVAVDPNRKSGEIIDEIQSGYKFKETVLRVPDVVVAK